MIKVIRATLGATKRKPISGVGELKSKRKITCLFFHSKLCIKLSFHTTFE
jgi:hypothetical protein